MSYTPCPRKSALDVAADDIARRLGRPVHVQRGIGFVHVATDGGTIVARGKDYQRALKAARAWCEKFDAQGSARHRG